MPGRVAEVILFDRPNLSVVQATHDGVRRYFLRVREGASRSIVRATMQALALNACRCEQRVTDDPKVTEIEYVERPASTDQQDHRAPTGRQFSSPRVAWVS